VSPGEEFSAAGSGSRRPGAGTRSYMQPSRDCANLGYIVDGTFYHPGDSLHVPG
jgi:hypothetical protein